MTRFSLREIALAGLIAAVYALLALIFLPISFGVYQVRVAEALTILPFITRAAIPGLFVGCLLANLFGGMGWHDVVFGSLITLLAAILTRLIYHLSQSRMSRLLAVLPVAVIWLGAFLLFGQTTVRWPVVALAWVMTLVITLIWIKGENPNLFLAPLPPVLLNAFGVSLYLAPIIGVSYWFSVQMVGIGQLIACYLLGLPLLKLVQRRASLLQSGGAIL